MENAEIRAALEQLLASELGTYQNASGETILDENAAPMKALYVGEPPSGWQAVGLEVVVIRTRNFSGELQEFGTQGRVITKEINISLRQHNKKATLEPALAKLLVAYPDADPPVVLEPSEALDSVEQTRFSIPITVLLGV